jgi:hypothetical protein
LLVWQSGKQDAGPGWPAWVVHFSDYCPDRKTPLDSTIRTALNKTAAQAIADRLIAENIKKCWEDVDAHSDKPPSKPKKESGSKSDRSVAASPKAGRCPS